MLLRDRHPGADQVFGEDDLAAVPPDRLDLGGDRAGWHADDGRDADAACGERGGGGVVSGRERGHPGRERTGVGPGQQRVDRAADLEASGVLKVFRFEKDLCAEFVAEAQRSDQRSPRHPAPKTGLGCGYRIERDERHRIHAATLAAVR
jgi:hypothetical protein